MADSNPKEIAEQIEKLAHALKTSRDFMDSFNESLNLTKTLTENVIKVIYKGRGKSPMLKTARDLHTELYNTKDISGKIVVMKKTEVEYQNILNSSVVKSVKETNSLKAAMEEIEKMRHNLGKAALVETFFLKGMASKYQNIQASTKSYGASMQAAGGYLKTLAPSMGKFGGAAAKAGGALAGMGLAVARFAGPLGIVISAIVSGGKAIFDVFKQADDAAMKFRMTMGITRAVTTQIDKDARSIAIGMANVGVTFEMAYNGIVAIATVMGSVVGYSKTLASTTALFTAQLGISADKTIQVSKAFAQISRSTMSSQRNMLGFAAKLSEQGGTNLAEVMGDIAEFSESSYRFMRGTAKELSVAAVEARRLGTSLGSTGKSAAALLNFTQSITDEMEASVLLGRSIDAQRARSLAYAGDMKGLTAEIADQAEQANFEFMDPIQQAAFARLFGKTEAELGKMIQAARELRTAELDIANDPALKKRADLYKSMIEASEKQARNFGKEHVNDLQREANQTRLLAIQQQWNKLVQELAEDWLPVIDEFLSLMIPVIKGIATVIKSVWDRIAGPIKLVTNLLKVMTGSAATGWEEVRKSGMQTINGWSWGTADLYNEWFKSNSPHKLGQALIDGFDKAAPSVTRALNAPVDAMADRFSHNIAQIKTATENISDGRMERPVPPGMGNIAPIALQQSNRENANSTANQAIMMVVQSINNLREDMLNGKIGATVRMDSQILAESIRRNTDFRNGYGTNNALAA